jgi:adenylate kinase
MELTHIRKWVIIIIGPPGAGKGTQSEYLAEHFGLFDFETSKIIEDKLKNASSDDKVIAAEKEKWLHGELNTPSMVLHWSLERITELARKGTGIVFSGSPRTLLEAQGELPVLEEYYGKENIKIFNLEVNEEESVKRNSHRRVCTLNRHPLPNIPEYKDITKCPKDGSELIRRGLDVPETIRHRYHIYLTQTLPILEFLTNKGYKVVKINGERKISEVSKDMHERLLADTNTK